MDPRDLQQIDSFLGTVKRDSLFAYYEVGEGVSASDLADTIKRKRGWAQGQQANPKYRGEALWLIKNNGLIRRVLLEQRDEYATHVSEMAQQAALTQLEPFIRGTLAGGTLKPEAERAILEQGRTLGVTEPVIRARLEQLLAESGAARAGGAAPRPAKPEPFRDFYRLLKIEPDANVEQIERAHRAMYRKARSKKDKQQVSALYADLDAAWRVLRDPVRRAAYDAQWRALSAGVAHTDLDVDNVDVVGFLAPPPGEEAGSAEPPGRRSSPPPRAKKPPKPPPPKPPAPKPPAPKPPPPKPPSSKQPSVSSGSPLRLQDAPPRRNGGRLNTQDEPTETPDTAPPRRAPPSPDGIGGRTLGLGQASRRHRRSAPRLAVASPEVVALKVARKPLSHSVIVKNSGDGKMPGRVTCDRDWVTLSRSRLDPDAAEQTIELTILPKELNRKKATALVTIIADHGERKAITVNVERTGGGVRVALGVVVAGLAVLAVGGGIALFASSRTPDVVPGTLVLEIDPVADWVEIDGERLPTGGSRIQVDVDFASEREVTVRTSLDGFAPDERRILVKPGVDLVESVRLELTADLSKPLAEDAVVEPLDPEISAKALAPMNPGIKACFKPGGDAISATAYVQSSGALVHLAGDLAPDQRGCVERQLRAVKFPVSPSYGSVELTLSSDGAGT
jgi:hypothetical protein